ncbi:bifunctional nuclease 2 [Silene latifolia]|uniref:bifunctional nuclease 2 n=1 Tax=Silene latifolia TaxID=37657 RepID=UPI003D77584F
MLRTEILSPTCKLIPHSSSSSSSSIIHSRSPFSLRFITPKKLIISCKNHTPSNSNHHLRHQPHDDFLEASLLLSETVKHHHLRKQGFPEELKQYPGQFLPYSTKVRGFENTVTSVGLSILRRFRHSTMFLKVSCEGNFLLPIVVGEVAVERLLDSVDEDDDGDYLNQFQFAKNLVIDLGYEIKMVKITKRVINTYFATIYFGKAGEIETFSVDARPSDAINVAKRCKAPIYVNKDIVSADAIRITPGSSYSKPIYDVLLDSPLDGPDSLVEELSVVRNMKLAVEEERYADAAKWRNELAKFHFPDA